MYKNAICSGRVERISKYYIDLEISTDSNHNYSRINKSLR